MNRREFRKRRIENDKELIEIRRKEANDFERKIQYDMAVKQKDAIESMVNLTLKLVKLEIKELLENKKE